MLRVFLLLTTFVQLAIANDHLRTNNKFPVISVIGNRFVDPNGYQFHIKGIAYQKLREKNDGFKEEDGFGFIDPLANPVTCLRDLEYLEKLNVNTVRVYQIDTSKNHDSCMNAFAEKGIYVLVDLPQPKASINRNSPYWDIDLYDRYISVVDSMSKYDNILGFVAGNEVTNSVINVDASPFVKAAIRDTKSYIRSKNYREIPVGYASTDDSQIRTDLANYFVCGDEMSKADFFALNMYEWCGYSSYTTSGYRERTLEFSEYPVPAFFGEFGCNLVTPRPFTEIESIYGLTMSKVWSGGIAYEYFQHENNYGVVKENKDGSVTPLEDFDTLSLRFAANQAPKIKVKEKSFNTTLSLEKKCIRTDIWKASSILPPTPDRGKCECLQSTLSCITSPFEIYHEEGLFNEICSKVDCQDVLADGLSGIYGPFSDCSMNQKTSYALNKHFMDHQQDEKVCNFTERAIVVRGNDNFDIKSIILEDGRTCETALNVTKIPDKKGSRKSAKGKKNRGSGYGKERGNNTSSLSSGSTKAESFVSAWKELIPLGIILILMKLLL